MPPRGTTPATWGEEEAAWEPVPALGPAAADEAPALLLRGVLDAAEIAEINALGEVCMRAEAAEARGDGAGSGEGGDGGEGGGGGGEGDEGGQGIESEHAMHAFDLFGGGELDVCAAAEEAWHAAKEHRLVHLHRGHAMQVKVEIAADIVPRRGRHRISARSA